MVLLGRTAAAYNEAVDKAVKLPPENASVRQRLANTLFAQIFAGSPRERHCRVPAKIRKLTQMVDTRVAESLTERSNAVTSNGSSVPAMA